MIGIVLNIMMMSKEPPTSEISSFVEYYFWLLRELRELAVTAITAPADI